MSLDERWFEEPDKIDTEWIDINFAVYCGSSIWDDWYAMGKKEL